MMAFSKRVSNWTVAEVFDWVREQYPSHSRVLQQAVAKHAISGRALTRMRKEQLSKLGLESKFQQEFLRDVLLLRIQEELENLSDIHAKCSSNKPQEDRGSVKPVEVQQNTHAQRDKQQQEEKKPLVKETGTWRKRRD